MGHSITKLQYYHKNFSNEISVPNKSQELLSNNKILVPNINYNPDYTLSKHIRLHDLKDLFDKYSLVDSNLKEHFITYYGFNSIIAMLFRFDIPILCHTYLSERIFDILTKKEKDKIYEEDFMEGIKLLLSSKEAKIRITFEAMRRIHLNYDRNTIELNEILEYFLNSWRNGLQLLENILSTSVDEFKEKNIFLPQKRNQLDFLVDKHEKRVKEYIVNSFSEYNINLTNGIGYEVFKKWIEKGHDLEIVYYNKRLKVAVSLLSLNDIVLVL